MMEPIHFTADEIRKLKELTDKTNAEPYSLGLLLDIKQVDTQESNKSDS